MIEKLRNHVTFEGFLYPEEILRVGEDLEKITEINHPPRDVSVLSRKIKVIMHNGKPSSYEVTYQIMQGRSSISEYSPRDLRN